MSNNNSTISTKTPFGHNYGIDALRILAMLMVVILHILGRGGILDAAVPMSIQYEAAWFLEIAAYCAVNCYALISGYVGVYSKYRYHNIVLLWLKVVFYTLSITLLFSISVPGSVSSKDWIKALLPVTGGYYWYFSAYFALFFFIPLLNIAMNKMTQRQHRAIVIVFLLVFSCLQTLFSREIFGTSSNAWWLMILYIIGGYIRKYGLFRNSSSTKMLGGYITIIILTWLSKIMIESKIFPFLRILDGKYLINNTSITILLSGIFLLLMFERIHFSPIAVKVIQFFSPTAFSVYLIHANPFVWNYILADRFAAQAQLPIVSEILSILLIAFSIFTICSFIDLIRAGIFNGLKIKQKLAKIETKYFKGLWD